MQGLKIYTKSGESPTSEEIEFAHRVANQHKEMKFGVITMTDQTSGVVAEYHAYNNTAFTSGDVGAYFGYDAIVDMRCWCRGIVLAETAAPSIVGISASAYSLSGGTEIWNVYVGETLFSTQTGSFNVAAPDMNINIWVNIWGGEPFGFGQGIVNGRTGTANDGSHVHDIVITPLQESTIGMAAQAAADAINAANSAAANQRSAVFLTDGTELGSVPRYTEATTPYPTERNSFFDMSNSWGGGSEIYTYKYNTNWADNLAKDASITVVVPEDACPPQLEAGVESVTVDGYNRNIIVVYYGENDPLALPSMQGFGYAVSGAPSAVLSAFITEGRNAVENYIAGITREQARRKKCSDGQLAYLRNGFLSPEFEYFVKTKHPVSALVRRDIPMEVVGRSQTLDYDVIDSNSNRTRIWTATVKIKYDVTDDNGVTTQHEKEFTGTVKQEDIEHYDKDMQMVSYAGTPIYTYTNLPMLVNGNRGKAYPLPSPLPSLPYSSILKLKTTNAFWHDDKRYPLLVEVNGTFYNSAWHSDDTYVTPAYYPEFTALIPTVQKTTDNLTFTHPQFLLDYIAASKPIEKEVIDGNKVPVTPSTNWLSSRLAHNEVVTIIPLSFVNADGEDRGMYPYNGTDEAFAQVKIVGFAKVKYNYFTGSFTFKSWTEFTTEGNIKHDGNASYDAETNPTSVNIGETVYTLQPKYFDYNPAWDQSNCVCIAGKTPWTDTKAAYETQKTNIADVPPEGHTLTSEELLYNEVRKAIK